MAELPVEFLRFLSSVLATVVWSLICALLLFGFVKLVDRFEPIDLHAEIQRGNVAAAILLSAYLLGLAFIISAVLRTP